MQISIRVNPLWLSCFLRDIHSVKRRPAKKSSANDKLQVTSVYCRYLGRAHEAKAEVTLAEIGIIVHRRREGPAITARQVVVARKPTDDPPLADALQQILRHLRLAVGRIVDRAAVFNGGLGRIRAPLAGVAVEVVEPPRVRLALADVRGRATAATDISPLRLPVRLRVAEAPLGLGARTAGILPLGLGRQAETARCRPIDVPDPLIEPCKEGT